MPQPLTDDQIDEIIGVYAEEGSIQGTIDRTERAEQTVRKYVKQALEEGDERLAHLEEFDEHQGDPEWQGAGPGESPFRSEEPVGLDANYSELSPGDFIEAFFEDFEVGVKNKWVQIQARRADRRGMLPTQKSLKADLLNMSSGVSQSAVQEAEYIAQEYWALAQQYLRQTGHQMDQVPMSHSNTGFEPAGMPDQSGMAGGEPGFVPPGSPGQPTGGQDPQMQMFQMMWRQMQDLQRTVQSQQQQPASPDEETDTLGRLHELKREKEILEELSGGDDRLAQVEQQMQSLQQQILSADQSAPAGGQSEAESFKDRLLAMAANDSEVALSDVLDVIEEQEAETRDPDIIEKEYEKQIREMELKHQQNRTEQVAGLFETLASRVGEGFAAGLTDPDSSEAAAAGSDSGGDTQAAVDDRPSAAADGGASPEVATNGDQPAAAQTAAPSSEECPHCGHDLMVGPNSKTCPNCEYGIGPCDLCGYPVTIPPVGKANYGRCGDCETVLEVPDDPDATVECPDCEWSGTGDETRGEILECENCGEYRPIMRADAMQTQVDELPNALQQ